MPKYATQEDLKRAIIDSQRIWLTERFGERAANLAEYGWDFYIEKNITVYSRVRIGDIIYVVQTTGGRDDSYFYHDWYEYNPNLYDENTR